MRLYDEFRHGIFHLRRGMPIVVDQDGTSAQAFRLYRLWNECMEQRAYPELSLRELRVRHALLQQRSITRTAQARNAGLSVEHRDCPILARTLPSRRRPQMAPKSYV